MQKVNIVEILVNRAEGPIESCGNKTFSSWSEANKAVSEMAVSAPEGGAYDKTDFKITYEDGFEYKGRLDLEFTHFMKSTPLSDHIVGSLHGMKRQGHYLETVTEILESYDLGK